MDARSSALRFCSRGGGVGKNNVSVGVRGQVACMVCRFFLDKVVDEECLSSFLIGDEDKLHRSFGRGEVRGRPVRLLVRRYKAHVSRRDVDEG